MKANQRVLRMREDRAEVGIGTLIVFIAMVLVAAVAAAVLISTSGSLQERAAATGKDATKQVSSSFKISGIYGQRESSTADVENITIHIELAAGASMADLSRLVIRYSDGANTRNYNMTTQTEPVNETWAVSWIRGDGTASNPVMEPGDLVQLKFALPSDLAERKDVEVKLLPETGTPMTANFRTPDVYGEGKTITLRE